MDWLLALALAPVAACMGYVYVADRYEPEPRGLVLAVMWGGVLSALVAVLGEQLYSATVESYHLVPAALAPLCQAFAGVALIEEWAKRRVFLRRIYQHPELDEPIDGIVYGVAASLGFAGIENVLYVLQGGVGVGLLRAFTSVPGHTCFGVIMGYCLSRARFSPSREAEAWWLRASLLVPTLAHGGYDYYLFIGQPLRTIALLVLLAVLSLGLIRRLQALSPHASAPPC